MSLSDARWSASSLRIAPAIVGSTASMTDSADVYAVDAAAASKARLTGAPRQVQPTLADQCSHPHAAEPLRVLLIRPAPLGDQPVPQRAVRHGPDQVPALLL